MRAKRGLPKEQKHKTDFGAVAPPGAHGGSGQQGA